MSGRVTKLDHCKAGFAMKTFMKLQTNSKPSLSACLGAQQQLFPAQPNLARTQRDELLAIVALYKVWAAVGKRLVLKLLESPNR